MKFLRYDSPFMNKLRLFTDYMLLGLLWVIASIPVFTWGAATSAAYQTADVSLRQEKGHIWKNFRTRFRKEFKQATWLGLLQILLSILVGFNVYLALINQLPGPLKIAILAAGFLFLCWSQLWLGYQSKFVDSIPTILLNSFKILFAYFPWALLMGILTVTIYLLAILMALPCAPLMMLLPGLYLMGYMQLFHKVFGQFLPIEEATEESC